MKCNHVSFLKKMRCSFEDNCLHQKLNANNEQRLSCCPMLLQHLVDFLKIRVCIQDKRKLYRFDKSSAKLYMVLVILLDFSIMMEPLN